MFAFYRSGDTLVKVYDMGDDWQVCYGPSERWFSTWAADRRASLLHAISATVESIGLLFDPALVVIASQIAA